MKLIIAGDFVIDKINKSGERFEEDIINLFSESDYNIVNLEAPVTEHNLKILKTGPHLKADKESTLDAIQVLNINAATLANNHILDYGEKGLTDTLDFCKGNQIHTVGAGNNLMEASKVLYLETREGKIAIINFAENEWASALENGAGASPMDLIDNAQQIRNAKCDADFVFVVVHGGHEYFNLPSPRMQKQYRFYADQGANMVIGHHTHCISGNEIYNGVPIFYSLGNFLFTKHSVYEDWYLGLLLQIEINGGKISTKLYPVRQEKKTFKLSILMGTEKQQVFDRIQEYNLIIEDRCQLANAWNQFVDSKYKLYLNYLSPLSFFTNRYLRGIFRRLNINFSNKQGISFILNLIRCEAHFDVSKQVLGKYLKK